MMHDPTASDDPGRNTEERMEDRPLFEDTDLDAATIGLDTTAPEEGSTPAVDDV